MPLGTLTCRYNYYPPDDMDAPVTDAHELVDALVDGLPVYVLENTDTLGLDQDTPLQAVQIDIHRFHIRARHAPELWLRMDFTEQRDQETRLAARDCLGRYMRGWADRADALLGAGFSWALDVFYAGCEGHGLLSDETGMGIVHDW